MELIGGVQGQYGVSRAAACVAGRWGGQGLDGREPGSAIRGVLQDEGGTWDRAGAESVAGALFWSRGIRKLMMDSQENPTTPPKVFDLSNELLSHGAIEALSDLLSVDFGLKKLVLESCGLDDEVRRAISLPSPHLSDDLHTFRRV